MYWYRCHFATDTFSILVCRCRYRYGQQPGVGISIGMRSGIGMVIIPLISWVNVPGIRYQYQYQYGCLNSIGIVIGMNHHPGIGIVSV